MKASWQILWELLSAIWRLRPHLRMGRARLAAVLFCAAASGPLEIAGVGLLLPMVRFLQGQGNEVLGSRYLSWLPKALPGRTESYYFIVFCVLIALTIMAKNTMIYIGQTLAAGLLSRSAENLRASMFGRLQRAPLLVFEENKAGTFSVLFNVDTVRTSNALEFLVLFFQRSCQGLAMFAAIVLISWQVTLAFIVLVGLLAAVTGWIYQGLKHRGAERAAAFTELGGFLNEAFGGVRVIRATNAAEETGRVFDGINLRLGVAERRASRASAFLSPFAETFGVFGAMGILAGAYHLLIRSGQLDPNNLMVLGLLLIRLLPLINQVQSLTGQLAYNLAGVKEVERWIGVPSFPERPFGAREFRGLKTGLRIDGLTYKYPTGAVALDNVSFFIPAGSTVALVGSSGSGKSTLASLLVRLREPTAGRILADDTDYWEYSAETWHRRLGVVEQEAFLFNDTLRRNLVVGVEGVSAEVVDGAVRKAHLEDVVAKLSKGLDSLVGERGTMLSGGQKQRLAIARALVRDPQILILDEATSALDNVSERQVQAALDEARQGRTSLVIAHRLTTVRNADLIVVLDGGRVVETGTWSELESRPGAFQKLLKATEKMA
jgi:ATP-binding cassette, subfamily B, bacterial MsbA